MISAAQAPRSETEYAVRVRNISVNSENVIHDDEGARALGFERGLVSGVTLYSYMTRPLVARFGPAALAGTSSRVAFFAPVFDGDSLRVASDPVQPETLARRVVVRAAKIDGEDVAVWELERPARLSEPAPPPDLRARDANGERPPFEWEAVVPGRPFHGFVWRPSAGENRDWCASVQDDLEPYHAGPRPLCHPGLVLQQANQALNREFRMAPWIHVSSRIAWHAPLRVGDQVEVRAVPLDKWEKQGDRYAMLRVAMTLAGRVALEIDHKAILQVAPR